MFCLLFGVVGCSNGDTEQTSEVSSSESDADGETGEHQHGSTHRGDSLIPRQKMETVLQELKPLQVLIGEWSGKTQKIISGAVSIEEPAWRRDFTTNVEQPALVFISESSPYFKTGRLTYLIDTAEYQLTVTDRYGTERVYQGTFSEPVRDVVGDDKNLQRTYKLQLVQVSPEEGNKWRQVVFNQQENNRYLLEIYDQRGGGMIRYDTVENQRLGTSFALNPDDYRGKECVISGGLGTMTVSHNGQSYYVCCSGCRDAFNDDPKTWIARYAKKKNRR